jgi:hypothetical protein
MDALNDAKKTELTAELRKARGWILAVGIIMFTMDMIMIYVVHGKELPQEWKTKLTMYDAIILAYFVGLWWFAQKKPKLCCVLALVGFWGLQIYVASFDPGGFGVGIMKGIILKVLFTLALVNGLKSANRAETLQKELANVFG